MCHRNYRRLASLATIGLERITVTESEVWFVEHQSQEYAATAYLKRTTKLTNVADSLLKAWRDAEETSGFWSSVFNRSCYELAFEDGIKVKVIPLWTICGPQVRVTLNSAEPVVAPKGWNQNELQFHLSSKKSVKSISTQLRRIAN